MEARNTCFWLDGMASLGQIWQVWVSGVAWRGTPSVKEAGAAL